LSPPPFPLYDWVKAYCDFGWHRTGTMVEENTLVWLGDLITQLGGQVEHHSYEFPYYEATVETAIEASGIHLEALYYSHIGEGTASSYLVERLGFDEQHGEAAIAQAISKFTKKAKQLDADALVLATGNDHSSLVAVNQAPTDPGEFPIFLAAGRDFQMLRNEQPQITFSASVKDKGSRNLIACFGDFSTGKPPLMITTPVSGWFSCAGERGTGLAIALSVASRVGENHPAMLLCPTGHELGYFGAERFAENFDLPLKAILHIGSCVAIKEDPSALLTARSNATSGIFQNVAEITDKAGVQLERPAEPLNRYFWYGEAECWASSGIPMVSIAGASHTFHTIDDLPEQATDQSILLQKEAMFLSIARELLENNL